MNIKKIISAFFAAGIVTLAALSPAGGIKASAAASKTVTVTSYGANGADKKYDTTAIQKALNKAKSTSGKLVVKFPKGTYYINKALVVYSNTHLKFEEGAVIRRTVEDHFFVNYNVKYSKINNGYNNTSSVTFEGGKFYGGRYHCGAINFWNANNITFKNVKFYNVAGSDDGAHVLLMNGVSDLTIKNCVFKNCCTAKDHIESEAVHTDYILAGFEGARRSLPCRNVTITGCTFSDVPSAIGTHHTCSNKATVFKIKNNKFTNVTYVCIDAPSFNKVYVYDNTAKNVGSFFKGDSGLNYFIRRNKLTLNEGYEYKKGRSYYLLYGIMLDNCRNCYTSDITGTTSGLYWISGSTKIYIDGVRKT